MLRKKVKKIREVEDSGIKADVFVKGKGAACRAQSLRREGRMEPGKDKLQERSQEMTRTRS